MKRLRLAIAALGCLIFAAATASAQTIKIGVILTYSGPNASLGEYVDKGLALYAKLHEKDLPAGTKIEIIRRDDTGPNPEVARRLAQELITRERVNFLGGVIFTPNGNAIAPLTAEAKVPFVIMNAAGTNTTVSSPYVTRTSFTLWQSSYPLGQWAAKQPNMKRGYTAVSDYAPGHDGEQAFIKGFTEGGGQMAGTVRMPLANPDFIPFMQRVKDAKPDVLYVFIPAGRQATAVMKAYQDLGLKDAGIRLVGPGDITTDEELPNMGDVPLGVITAHHYAAALKNPQNQAFVAAWKKEYGAESTPNFMGAAGWDGMAAIFHAIKAQNGKVTPDGTMAALKGWKHDSPRGPIMLDPETRDIIQNEYIREVKRVDGRLQNIEFETIPMVKDPFKVLNPPK
jgi:branched-chain amino acid transport system substrate-binding protein